jgi:hypothetical protein
MKTLVSVFLAGSILILIGSGCGDSSTSAGGTTGEGSTTPAATESPATPRNVCERLSATKSRLAGTPEILRSWT